ncbi:YdeI/OmpD-associated family protein [Mucilaginibacter calamicampi]|uniref:YdeI/OmpD-associated family protein n=1 Tax=Mucilaginibacter calamicampi TaxID=1302352 RepID=A0ABW2YTI6_9SPHI
MSNLAAKLKMKPGSTWLLFGFPENYPALLELFPADVVIKHHADGEFDNALLFVKDNAELTQSLQVIAELLKPGAIFWIIYPKKNSGIESDLEMMSSWDICKKYGLRPVASAAIDQTWTALRFKPFEEVKSSEGSNQNIRQNEYLAYIDVDNKKITLPPVMAAVLEKHPGAFNFYNSLSYSNKKEYVLWILTAKQEKTREERLAKMIEKLKQGRKNSSEKPV